MKSILDRSFKYVPSKDQTADYLRSRFDEIRAQMAANKAEAETKVSTIKPKLKARTA